MKSIFICAAIILSVSVTAFSQNTRNDEVTALVKKMIVAQSAFDYATLEKIYANDYIEISPVGEVDEREKAIGFYKVENPAEAISKSPKSELDEFNIRNYDKFSIVIAKLTFKPRDNTQKTPVFSIRTVFVCRKEKGNWKIISAQFTGLRPPRSQPSK